MNKQIRNSQLLIAHLYFGSNVYANNKTKQTNSATEYFNNQNFNKQRRICGVCQRSARTNNPHGNATNQIHQAHAQPSGEYQISSHPILISDLLRGVHIVGERFQLARHDDCRNQSINGDRFAEDHGNEVFGLDSWSFHSTTDDTYTRRVYSQRGPDHRQRHRERYAQHGPHVWRCVGQKPSDADLFTFAGQQVKQNDRRHDRARRTEERIPQYRSQSHF